MSKKLTPLKKVARYNQKCKKELTSCTDAEKIPSLLEKHARGFADLLSNIIEDKEQQAIWRNVHSSYIALSQFRNAGQKEAANPGSEIRAAHCSLLRTHYPDKPEEPTDMHLMSLDDEIGHLDHLLCWFEQATIPPQSGQLEQSPEKDKFNKTEHAIIEALGDQKMKGEEIANSASRPFNSQFRATLSSLVKRKILSSSNRGYNRLS